MHVLHAPESMLCIATPFAHFITHEDGFIEHNFIKLLPSRAHTTWRVFDRPSPSSYRAQEWCPACIQFGMTWGILVVSSQVARMRRNVDNMLLHHIHSGEMSYVNQCPTAAVHLLRILVCTHPISVSTTDWYVSPFKSGSDATDWIDGTMVKFWLSWIQHTVCATWCHSDWYTIVWSIVVITRKPKMIHQSAWLWMAKAETCHARTQSPAPHHSKPFAACIYSSICHSCPCVCKMYLGCEKPSCCKHGFHIQSMLRPTSQYKKHIKIPARDILNRKIFRMRANTWNILNAFMLLWKSREPSWTPLNCVYSWKHFS